MDAKAIEDDGISWCPFCGGQGEIGGSSSWSSHIDPLTGKREVKHRRTPGRICSTCQGSGCVRIIYEPVSRNKVLAAVTAAGV